MTKGVCCGCAADLQDEITAQNRSQFVVVKREPFTMQPFYRSCGLVRFIGRRHRAAINAINAAIVAVGGPKTPW